MISSLICRKSEGGYMSVYMKYISNQKSPYNPVNKKYNVPPFHIKDSKAEHGVSIITITNRINHIKIVFANYNRQNIKNKELIVILNNNSMNLNHWRSMAKNYPNVRVLRKDESITFAECKNYAVTLAKFPYITHFDDDDYYGENFLRDILRVFDKVDADIVGKRSAFVYFKTVRSWL